MRFLLALAAWVVFVGGLYSYTAWRDARVVESGGTAAAAPPAAERKYDLEITTTFSLEEDPFALRTDGGGSEPLELRLNGRPVPVPVDEIRRGRPLKLEGFAGTVRGRNEIHVRASPPVDETLDNGVRIRIFEDGAAIADATIWGGGGALVSGTVPFSTTGEEQKHDH